MINIMDGNSARKDRTNCYIKIVCENYYCDCYEKIIRRIHLVFRSKKDYDKISDIEKMIKKYFKIEEKYLNTEKKYFIYYYLKEMIKQLEEYEVMEVYSDSIQFNSNLYFDTVKNSSGFGTIYNYITIINNNKYVSKKSYL